MDTTVAFARNHRTADSFAYIASPVVGDALLGTVVMIPDARLLRKLVQSQTYGGQVVDIFYATSEGSFQSRIHGTTIDRSTELGRSLLRASLGQDINRETSFWEGEWLTHIRAVPTIQAVMVLRRDRDVVLQSVQELRYGGWGVTLIAILLTVLISRRLSINLAAPIRALSDSIERITEGDREVSVDVNRKDELGALAQQFNHMATSLRDTQAQLVQTEKMASIGHLAAGIAHEINNPMSVVTANMNTMKEYAETYVKLADLFAQYLNPQDESEREDSRTNLEAFEKEEDIDFVHQDMKALLQDSQLGLSRVQHIVSSLKIFSELDKSEEQDIDLRQTLEQVVSDIAPAASRSTEITYQIELEGSIRVKPEQMQKVFAAVIDNALKACTEKGSLRIKAWRENKTLMIDFQDTGCGMSGEQVTKVFDPFYTTRDVGEGVGLGLSIAHAIVEAHNGTVKVASKEGRGTRIRLVLPQR
jgi:signal transduction histidine kinase